jgi:polar amino acid transport system substrate-binding protein
MSFTPSASRLARIAFGISALAIATVGFVATAGAATPDEIKQRGTAIIGVQMDQFPWGFIDAKGENDGFDLEVSKMIADDLGVKTEFKRITGQNRIPLLINSEVDFLVPSMTVTAERAKVIQYVLPYSANDITVWAKKDAAITGNNDLGKYVIGVNRGSSFESLLDKVAPDATQIRRFDDDATTVQALLSGQVDAILGSLTYGLIIKSVGQSDAYERKYKVADNIQAMAVRKGDQEMLAYLNDFVARNKDKIDALYKKWIGVDRPELPTEMPGVDFTGTK